MTIKTKDKNCLQCGEMMIGVSPNQKYCDKCKKAKYIENWKKKNKGKSPYTEDEYYSNFMEVTKHNEQTLTTIGFNELSKINYRSYINFFKLSWNELLHKYGKFDLLMEYVKDEFNKSTHQGITPFINSHKYIELNGIDNNFLRIMLDLPPLKYNDEDYKINFFDVVNKLGTIPLYGEFLNNSKIKIETYATHFELKDNVYEAVLKMYISEEDFNKYKTRHIEYKSNSGKISGTMNKKLITTVDLETEFRRVFDECFLETGVYPSTNLFNKLSKYDDSNYRRILDWNWTNICKSYGYSTQQKQSIFETYVLKHMSIVLNENYESQKVFPWLIGVNDFPLFCDGYFEKHNLIVEVDGRQHRKPYAKFGGEKAFKTLQANDNVKNELIPEHGIKLLRIADNTTWHDVEYLRSRLEEVLGSSNLVAK